MRIDVVFDTVCPWCYLGTRRLATALAHRPGVAVDLRYHPFLLNPDMPTGGIDRKVYLERKFGGLHRARRVLDAVAAAADGTGTRFDFDAIRRMPNSVDSHRLLKVAEGVGRFDQTLEALFQAFFTQGRDIGDHAVLRAVAAAVGVPDAPVAQAFERRDGVTDILAANGRAHAQGINGVPTFVFNGRYAIAGAQEPDVLLRLIDLALETEVREPVTVS